jgi:hypothetical protein
MLLLLLMMLLMLLIQLQLQLQLQMSWPHSSGPPGGVHTPHLPAPPGHNPGQGAQCWGPSTTTDCQPSLPLTHPPTWEEGHCWSPKEALGDTPTLAGVPRLDGPSYCHAACSCCPLMQGTTTTGRSANPLGCCALGGNTPQGAAPSKLHHSPVAAWLNDQQHTHRARGTGGTGDGLTSNTNQPPPLPPATQHTSQHALTSAMHSGHTAAVRGCTRGW